MGFLQTGQFCLIMLVVGGDVPYKEMNKPRGNGVCHQCVFGYTVKQAHGTFSVIVIGAMLG